MKKHAAKTYTCTECPKIFETENAKDLHLNEEHSRSTTLSDINMDSLTIENTESFAYQIGSPTIVTEIAKDLQWSEENSDILSDTQVDSVNFDGNTTVIYTCQLCLQNFQTKFDKDLHWDQEHAGIILFDTHIDTNLGSIASTKVEEFYELELNF